MIKKILNHVAVLFERYLFKKHFVASSNILIKKIILFVAMGLFDKGIYLKTDLLLAQIAISIKDHI